MAVSAASPNASYNPDGRLSGERELETANWLSNISLKIPGWLAATVIARALLAASSEKCLARQNVKEFPRSTKIAQRPQKAAALCRNTLRISVWLAGCRMC